MAFLSGIIAMCVKLVTFMRSNIMRVTGAALSYLHMVQTLVFRLRVHATGYKLFAVECTLSTMECTLDLDSLW